MFSACGSPVWRGCFDSLGLVSEAFMSTVDSVSEALFTTQISRFSGCLPAVKSVIGADCKSDWSRSRGGIIVVSFFSNE